MGTQKNLIYIFADQLRYSSVGYSGDKRAKTPNIDRLASQSVDMCNAISGYPVCAPYRASLFTGKYTTSTGMVINEIRINPEHHKQCFAHMLNNSGYETAYIGKWHMYAAELGNHFDSKNSYIPKGPDRLGFDGYFAAYNFHHDYYGAPSYYHLDSPEKHYCDKYEPDTQTDMAIEQLNQLYKGENPFALFLSLGTPHDPWIPQNVPGKYLEMFENTEFELPPNYEAENDSYADNWARLSPKERLELTEWMRCYYAMVANLDDNIGRLMNHIHSLGLDENSIVVFTSDHGEMFGAHGRRAKNIFYEEAVRVPFLIRQTKALEEGKKCDVVFNTVDIMPSLLSLMNIEIPNEVEGSDYSECIKGAMQIDDGALMMCTGPTAIFGNGNEWRGWRTKQFTYAVYKCDGMELLFDNIRDPYQMNNLIDDENFALIKKEMKDAMYKKMADISDTFENNLFYEQNWVVNRLIQKTATCGV